MVEEQTTAPNFSLKDQSGKLRSLSDFKGKYVVLYFYPKDNTPGCTLEAIDFTRLKPKFEKLNAVILGISKDNCKSHEKFVKARRLDIILLSDEDSSVQKKYGVWRKKKFMGREYIGTVRSTALIDPKGKVLKLWDNVRAIGHAEDVLSFLKDFRE